MKWEVVLEPSAFKDIQDAIDYYDSKKTGLGKGFEKAINQHFENLSKTPYYAVLYDRLYQIHSFKSATYFGFQIF